MDDMFSLDVFEHDYSDHVFEQIVQGGKSAVNRIIAESHNSLDELRKGLLESKVWQSRRGIVQIRSMDLSHIENCVSMLRQSLMSTDEKIAAIGKVIAKDPSNLEYHYAALGILVGTQVATEASIKRFLVEMEERGTVSDVKQEVRGTIIKMGAPGTTTKVESDHPVDSAEPHIAESEDIVSSSWVGKGNA